MKVKIAGHSGFCFGVKRAINIANSALKNITKEDKLYSLGPIIHNPQVVNRLSDKGLIVIKDISKISVGTIIISSHGAPEDIIEKLKRKKLKIIDATCPFVKYAQNIVRDLKEQGYYVVIVGDKMHPEVRALVSIAGRQRIKGKSKIGIVSQTTQNKENYISEIHNILKGEFSEIRIFNTICRDAALRQASAKELLKKCDLMIVIGGKNSANTRRLWQICKESGVESLHIETEKELKPGSFSKKKCIGITSGASTADWIVDEVVEAIRKH